MILQRVLGFVFMVIFFGGMGITILAFLGRRHTMLNGDLIDNQGSVLSVHVSTSLEEVERLARGLSENLEIPIQDPDLLLTSI